MFPDEIGSIPAEDHNATAPVPEAAPAPIPEPPYAPSYDSAPPYAPPAPPYEPPAQPPYAPAAETPVYAAPAPQYEPTPQYEPPAQPQYAPQYAPVAGAPVYGDPLGDAKGISIAGMVLGIASIPFASILFAIIGLVLSIQGQKKTPPGVQNNYAKAGKICSIIGIVIGALVICAYVIILAVGVGSWSSLSNVSRSIY